VKGRKFFAGEPGDLAQFTVGGSRVASDDSGFVDRAHVGDAIPIGIGDLVVWPAKDVQQPGEAHLDAQFLA
jgi:hypothetical protein